MSGAHSATSQARRIRRRLTLFTLSGLAALGALALLNYLLLAGMIAGQDGDAATINVSGRQRMLSQRISVMSLRYATAPDEAARAEAGKLLTDAIHLMRTSHAALSLGSEEMGIPAPSTDAIREHYFGDEVALDRRVGAYLADAETLLAAPESELGPDNLVLVNMLKEAQKPLLRDLNTAVGMYEADSSAQVAMVNWIVGVVTLLTLALLAAEGIWLFRPMIRNVVERIEEINRARELLGEREANLRLVLDSTGDGLCPVDAEGRIQSGASARVSDWFPEAKEGVPYWQAFAPDDEDLALRMECDFEQLADGFLPFEMQVEQMLGQIAVGERILSLSYRAIGDSESPSGYLIVASDITARMEALAAEEAAREEQQVVMRLLDDRESFLAFLDEAERILVQAQDPDRSFGDRLRDLHTLKGNVSLYGFAGMARRVHALEDLLEEDPEMDFAGHMLELHAVWTERLDGLQSYLDDEETGIWLAEGEWEHHLSAVLGGIERQELADQVRRWRDEPVKRRLEDLGKHADRLAQRLGKQVQVAVHAESTLRVPRRHLQEMWASLVHVVRNAVDHGIEDAETRMERGKPEVGTIRLEAQQIAGGIVVAIQDDGGGIDFDRLRTKASERGYDVSGTSPVELLSLDGLSSRQTVTEVSGRGVGMSAVAGALEALDGEMEVHSDVGQGTRFEFGIPLLGIGEEPTRIAS